MVREGGGQVDRGGITHAKVSFKEEVGTVSNATMRSNKMKT